MFLDHLFDGWGAAPELGADDFTSIFFTWSLCQTLALRIVCSLAFIAPEIHVSTMLGIYRVCVQSIEACVIQLINLSFRIINLLIRLAVEESSAIDPI